MSQMPLRAHVRLRLLILAGPVVVLAAPGFAADDKKAAPRVAVARCGSPTGMILQHEGKRWQPAKQGGELFSGDLLVGLPGAIIDSKNGAVRMVMQSDLEGNSPFPVLESAVVLHSSAQFDLELTLDRGRIELANRQDKAARVRLLVRHDGWELTFEPGARLGLELYGRWPRGVHFHKDNPKEVPTAELIMIVLKGGVGQKHGNKFFAMQAPPGPALFHWDSVAGADAAPRRLEKLPAWADPEAQPSASAKEKEQRLQKFRERLNKESFATVVAQLLKSPDLRERRLALVAVGSVDNLSALVEALSDPKHADTRDLAVLVLRHWIGRGPGQDLKLYNLLIEEKKFAPGHADIMMRLLHSFGEADLGRPETYEALIAYLNHDRLAIRELAKWHLYRLVPAAKDIPYDPAAPEKERAAACAAWKKLIPDGKVPPKPAAKKE